MSHKLSVAILFLLSIAALTLAVRVAPAFAQSETVSESEVGTLKEDIEGIKADLEEIKKELKLLR